MGFTRFLRYGVFTYRGSSQTVWGETGWGCLLVKKSVKGSRCPPVSQIPDPRSQRVLLVEDDNASQLLEGIVLARLGLEVDLARNGAEALEFLSRKDYALVIMDCVMPVMGGIEATRRIRDGSANSRNPDIPIIAITADAMPENLKACKLAGMNDCLTKPASLAAVREIIQKWLPVAGETSTT